MGFSQESGYVPTDINTIMNSIMLNLNAQFGTTYTADSFVGTNFYKYFYALAQEVQGDEIKTSEIFAYLQQYITIQNERISRPVVTNPGLIEKFQTEGYIASVKPMILADAGKISICVDVNEGPQAAGSATISNFGNLITGTADSIKVGTTTFTAQAGVATPGTATFRAATSNNATALSLATQINSHATAGSSVRATAVGAVVGIKAIHGGSGGNSIALLYTNGDANVGASVSGATLTGGSPDAGYAAKKLAINTIIKDSTVAGAVTQGTEVSTIVLSNGQSFDFKFFLPNRIPVLLRLTITLSENNQVVVGAPDATKLKLLSNIQSRYRLGRNFEPQRYFSVTDAPWASSVLLEWSTDAGATYSSSVYDAAFDALFDVKLENIELVEV